jgi:hypothetical protein
MTPDYETLKQQIANALRDNLPAFGGLIEIKPISVNMVATLIAAHLDQRWSRDDDQKPPPCLKGQRKHFTGRKKSTAAEAQIAVHQRSEGRCGMTATRIVRQPAGDAITGHPDAFSILPLRADWPWRDDFAPLDATNDAFDSDTLDCTYIGFTSIRGGTY